MILVPASFTTANAILAKAFVVLITIDTYPRVFTNRETGVSGQYDWIVDDGIQDLGVTVSDLEGGAELADFTFTVQDRGGAITGDFPTHILEGKRVVVTTGFVGQPQAEFGTLFTGQVDIISSTDSNTAYTFTCVDNKQTLTKPIYTVGDDAQPTSSDHPRTLLGHPLDILLAILQDEIGMVDSDIDINKIQQYRDGPFAGLQFSFKLTQAPSDAKTFIEQQIMQELGGYYWFNNLGQFTVNFFYKQFAVTQTTIGSKCRPWMQTGGINSAFPFTDNPPYTLPTAIPCLVGQAVVLLYLRGVVSRQPGSFPDTGPLGQTDGGSGTGQTANWPGAWVSGTCFPSSCIGAFASASGQLVAAPFAVGTGGTFTPPAGATQLLLGVNDISNYSDNGGAWVFAVGGANSSLATFPLNPDNLTAIPEAGQSDLVNNVLFHFDKNDQGTFLAQPIEEYGLSISRYGQVGQQQIESDGMRAAFQGYFQAAFTARMIFYRYGLKNLKFDGVTALWTACVLEPGDIVAVTESHIPDRVLGTIGISAKLFEITDRSWNFSEGIVTLSMIDASYISKFAASLITPNSQAVYTSSSSGDKAKYFFVGNASDQYSNSDPAHTLG